MLPDSLCPQDTFRLSYLLGCNNDIYRFFTKYLLLPYNKFADTFIRVFGSFLLRILHPPLLPDLRHEMRDVDGRVESHPRRISCNGLLHVEDLVAECLRRAAGKDFLTPAVLRPRDDGLIAARIFIHLNVRLVERERAALRLLRVQREHDRRHLFFSRPFNEYDNAHESAG